MCRYNWPQKFFERVYYQSGTNGEKTWPLNHHHGQRKLEDERKIAKTEISKGVGGG